MPWQKVSWIIIGSLQALFELKLNKDADAAMKQIDLKEYPKRFALSGLPIVKVGVNFDVATHNITDWKIEAE